ncbi:hypothetical protein CVT25_000116 [Psilocybe cyanescens]|uniref:Protein kinase domain-containing protein n=1 Tax=Psilocybe cyanescens TaxID=93625 RepID=A0A409WZ40_PSICY|nr:hypothetical protein CVT25_000116 [Psilocybe cyanescens]
MGSPVIKITFPFEPGVIYDSKERFAFWDSPNTIQWFKDRGYTLYQRIWDDSRATHTSFPTFPPDTDLVSKNQLVEAEGPYAYYDLETMDHYTCIKAPLRAREPTGKVVFAQDSLKRHVTIKLVRDDTDEYRVLRYLNQQNLEILKENCVIPVLELLPIEGFWFAVMPRVTNLLKMGNGDSPSQSFIFARCCCYYTFNVEGTLNLKRVQGMSYLHDHKIAHGDINITNVLVNHFSDTYMANEKRKILRHERSLCYALFDFDFSVMLPPEINKKEYRLPYDRSWGSFNISNDTSAGEYDYDPFVFDVGAMGVTICQLYQHLAEDLPFLAPLLDMMTTWDLERRFTAFEALQFFEKCLSEVSEENLSFTVSVGTRIVQRYNKYNRWENVPPEFAERWKAYKAPPIPWHLKMLRFIYRHSRNDHILPMIREIYDNSERFAFWDSPYTIQWFKDRGYTLYQRIWDESEAMDTSFPVHPSEVEFVEAEYPYACYDLDTMDCSKAPLRAREVTGKVMFAQDFLKRHVAIKLVQDDTDEYRVLRYLSQQNLDILKENCIIPILDLIPVEGFWFAVMPRQVLQTTALELASQSRKLFEDGDQASTTPDPGLSYLHDHNIAHGDINDTNVLVNHFSDMYLLDDRRTDLRSSKSLSYALFDFDFSTILAPEANKKEFRLPYRRSWGTFNVSYDTAAGEYDYNPFVFDVGAMGVSLCSWHQHLAKDLPLLAPLLDMMTTWDLDCRFTASEALRFFEERLSEVPEEDLQINVSNDIPGEYYMICNRWENIPPDFAERWKAYKTPPIPWHLKTLRFINEHSINYNIIPQTRLFFFRLSSMPRRFYRRICPPKITL